MRKPSSKIISRAESEYLLTQIHTNNNNNIKRALQALCKYMRMGMVFDRTQIIPIQNALVATAFRETDSKVRRWLLNAMARACNENESVPAIKHILSRHPDEPQTIASGIAAIYKLCPRKSVEQVLKNVDFSQDMRVLAALQHVPPTQLDLSCLPIVVENAGPDIIQLALVVVGLGKSPENMFSPRYSDAEMIKAIGRHHDPLVVQYSVWAVTENPKLGVRDLGVNIHDIEGYTPNVRSWVFQLISGEPKPTTLHSTIIEHAIKDPDAEARLGLAVGMKHNFISHLEPLVLSWFCTEYDEEVSYAIMDHIVRCSDKSKSYEDIAVEVYECESTASSLRRRMLINSSGTDLHAKFRKFDYEGGGDLFSGVGGVVVTNTYNICNINAGAVSFGDGDATNSGQTNIQAFSKASIEQLMGQLAEIEAKAHTIGGDESQKKELLAAIGEAKANPTPDRIQNLVETINRAGMLAEAYTALSPYVPALLKLIGFG